MRYQVPGGCYYLREDVRLVHGSKEGLVKQSAPLRVIRVNQTAMGILEKCRAGFSVPVDGDEGKLST